MKTNIKDAKAWFVFVPSLSDGMYRVLYNDWPLRPNVLPSHRPCCRRCDCRDAGPNRTIAHYNEPSCLVYGNDMITGPSGPSMNFPSGTKMLTDPVTSRPHDRFAPAQKSMEPSWSVDVQRHGCPSVGTFLAFPPDTKFPGDDLTPQPLDRFAPPQIFLSRLGT